MIVQHDLTKDGKLKILQDTTKNSYTFDSILLANFVSLNKKSKLAVDLCSGNAPIAMLLTRRNSRHKLQIKAIEIQTEIAKLGAKSIELNQLDNVQMINRDLIDISSEIGKNMYNLVTCNPPYFKVNDVSNINESESVAIARHEILVNLEQIIDESRKLLDNNGVLAMVFRPERLDELIILLEKYKFKLKRIQFVYPKLGENCNTILIEAKRGQNKGQVIIEQPLFVYNADGSHTKEALEIINM